MKRNYNKMARLSAPHTKDYSKIQEKISVIPHQAVTPSQMLELANQGIPISSDNAAAYSGEINPSWNLPSEKLKHVDPAELWEEQQTIRKKVRDMHQRDKRLRMLEKEYKQD